MQLQQRLVLVTRLLLAVIAKSPVLLSQSVSVRKTRLNICSIAIILVMTMEMLDLLKHVQILRLVQGKEKELKIKVHQKGRIQSLGLGN